MYSVTIYQRQKAQLGDQNCHCVISISDLLTPPKHIVVNHFDIFRSEHLDNLQVQMQSLH